MDFAVAKDASWISARGTYIVMCLSTCLYCRGQRWYIIYARGDRNDWLLYRGLGGNDHTRWRVKSRLYVWIMAVLAGEREGGEEVGGRGGGERVGRR